MASTAQIIRHYTTRLTDEERAKEFLEIIRPLGYVAKIKYDDSVYMTPKENDEKAVHVWVDQEEYPLYTINGIDYYREVFFDWIWDDDRHGIESMNSDMILAIVREYMKKYPDALFEFEWSHEDNKFLDKTDIDTIASQPFDPEWFGEFKSHLTSSRADKRSDDWTLK